MYEKAEMLLFRYCGEVNGRGNQDCEEKGP